jgi:hypothetical protein
VFYASRPRVVSRECFGGCFHPLPDSISLFSVATDALIEQRAFARDTASLSDLPRDT